jgi:lipid-A-disaccharide synthase
MSELLVVAGEASGDRAAAGVLAALVGVLGRKVAAYGMGGAACAAAGLEVTRDFAAGAALGFGEVAARAFHIRASYRHIVKDTAARPPRAALLVNYTEFNARLSARLHATGVRVLWYGAPQIWAWRSDRAASLRRGIDRMAVMLPFEEELWRKEGVDARYVGHPARERVQLARARVRERLGLTPFAPCVVILPGSRAHEVDRLLAPMLEAYERVRKDRATLDARIGLAPSLDVRTRERAIELSRRWAVETIDIDPIRGFDGVLEAFDVALVASGTATLEAALSEAVPVVLYKVGAVSEIVARHLVKTPNIALPNILLGRRVFPELVQRDVSPGKVAEALAEALDRREELVLACHDVRAALGDARTPSLDVARMLAPWLSPGEVRSS